MSHNRAKEVAYLTDEEIVSQFSDEKRYRLCSSEFNILLAHQMQHSKYQYEPLDLSVEVVSGQIVMKCYLVITNGLAFLTTEMVRDSLKFEDAAWLANIWEVYNELETNKDVIELTQGLKCIYLLPTMMCQESRFLGNHSILTVIDPANKSFFVIDSQGYRKWASHKIPIPEKLTMKFTEWFVTGAQQGAYLINYDIHSCGYYVLNFSKFVIDHFTKEYHDINHFKQDLKKIRLTIERDYKHKWEYCAKLGAPIEYPIKSETLAFSSSMSDLNSSDFFDIEDQQQLARSPASHNIPALANSTHTDLSSSLREDDFEAISVTPTAVVQQITVMGGGNTEATWFNFFSRLAWGKSQTPQANAEQPKENKEPGVLRTRSKSDPDLHAVSNSSLITFSFDASNTLSHSDDVVVEGALADEQPKSSTELRKSG